MKNIFSNSGDNDVLELYKSLRLGTIVAVDESNALVTIQWLDKSGIRTQVPLSMPFCEQGWGIYAMPRKYTIVICLTRPYEFPIVIGYLPQNFTMPVPNSFFPQYKQQSSMPQEFKSGELIFRNMINKAKCGHCGTVSPIADWTANYGYVSDTQFPTLKGLNVEKCPSCGYPAVVLADNKVDIQKVYKIQMGTLIYMQQDGKVSIKINDGLNTPNELGPADDFSKGSLIEIEFDDNSNAFISGVQDFSLEAGRNLSIEVSGDDSVATLNVPGDNGRVVINGKQEINLNDGSNGVARKEDKCGYLYFNPGSGGATLTYSKTKIIPVPPITEVGPIEIVDSSDTVKAGD